jgi:ABC-type transport system involved in multi-copper enzyme maturation permease subunit
MRQFLAILQDSFREAVDGFVIYLMLGLSLLLLVLLGSISYKPDAPEDALPRAMRSFAIIFPDRGASTAPTGVPTQIRYKAESIQETPGGARFVLHADPRELRNKKGPDGKDLPEQEEVMPKGGPDGFRYAVYAWKQPAGERLKNPFADRGNQAGRARGRNEMELVMPPEPSEGGLRGVTDEDMAAFIKYQFATFVGITDVAVSRKPGVAEPDYKFDVELNGISGAPGWPNSVYVFFGAVPPLRGQPLGQVIYFIEDIIVNGLGAAITLMLSVVITAFFIPNLLRKGSVDLLVSKPIGRAQLLIYKYVGGLTFIFLLSSFTIGGVWLVMAARSGNWNPSFLLVIPVLTFTFAILYSVSTVVAVFTRSAIASILVTLGFMLALYIFGQVKSFFDTNKIVHITDLPDWSYTLVDGLNNVLPRYKDLDKLTAKLVVDSTLTTGEARLQGIFTEYPSWGGAVGVSLVFIAVMLAISCWRFSKRDY